MKWLALILVGLVICSGQIITFPPGDGGGSGGGTNTFNTNQFTVNGSFVSLSDPLTVTNFYSSNIFVTNIVANTIYTTNIYATNLYVTNIYQDLVFHGKVTFNTNVTFVSGITNAGAWNLNVPAFLYANGAYYTNIFVGNMATGTNDVMTVPAGYRVGFLLNTLSSTNTSSSTVAGYLKNSGTYYPIFSTATVTTNAPSGTTPFQAYMFDEGETVAYSTTVTGINIFIYALVVPTNSPFISKKLLALTTGLDTVYTVPTGKRVIATTSIGSAATAAMTWLYVNASGSQRTLNWYIVPPGDSPTPANLIKTGPIANGVSAILNLVTSFAAGTSFVIQSDVATATQWSHMNIFEIDQP